MNDNKFFLIFSTALFSSLTTLFISNWLFHKKENDEYICLDHPAIKNDVASKTFSCYAKFVNTTFDIEDINVYKNEKKWLIKMKDSTLFPKLIYANDKLRLLLTINAGKLLNKENLPEDYKLQFDNILNELKKYNCRHNDIKPSELVIKNNKINLIDFGWAHELSNDNPISFPPYLGDEFKCDPYDDKGSIEKCLNKIRGKRVSWSIN